MDLYERLASYVPTVLVVSVVYCASVSFYRIFLHPLAKVPGPWPAATSHLVEFYYDVLRDGQYIAKIKEWHGVYGTFCTLSYPSASVSCSLRFHGDRANSADWA